MGGQQAAWHNIEAPGRPRRTSRAASLPVPGPAQQPGSGGGGQRHSRSWRRHRQRSAGSRQARGGMCWFRIVASGEARAGLGWQPREAQLLGRPPGSGTALSGVRPCSPSSLSNQSTASTAQHSPRCQTPRKCPTLCRCSPARPACRARCLHARTQRQGAAGHGRVAASCARPPPRHTTP